MIPENMLSFGSMGLELWAQGHGVEGLGLGFSTVGLKA